ncbi:MAG TPA: VWA domain-containing protein [Alphaproteobacteria bacterium]|nr:VWA domain-containing protein [Alphaproteobacteria bacterium]
MSNDRSRLPSQPPASGDVAAFLERVAAMPAVTTAGQGRLLVGIDATASRQATWDTACHIQSEMFAATGSLGGLAVRLCFYRGFNEFKATPWLSDPADLQRRMSRVVCAAGQTQIGRLLDHAAAQTRERKVQALVFVGDCVEEEAEPLYRKAGELGVLGVPCFLFQEGDDPVASKVFARIADLTRGAHCRFDRNSAGQLKALLGAVAVYAAGGRRALANYARDKGGAAALLIGRMAP